MSSEMNENGKEKTQSFAALSIGLLVSHYKILERVGAGGMGEVYLAEDTELNRKVALKFLPPHLCQDEECRTRFKREAQAAAKLSHPNIVHVYEVSEYRGRPFFAMEYIDGPSLRDIIKEKQLSIDRAIALTIQICEGLGKAHQAGIIHRDIKPSNIMIDADGRPRLLDFGLATIRGREKLTRTGSTLGTVAYMSPEQVKGQETDQRSDIFSVGILLYEMIAGRRPFGGDSEAAIMRSILDDTPEPLARFKADVPDDLQRIMDEALDKDLDTRYQTAIALATDLKRLKKASETTTFTRPLKAPRKKGTLRFLIPGSIVVVIALLLVLFKPWTFEIRPAAEAIAAENRLAIMYFDNLADPGDKQRYGEIVTDLLITDLSESHYVQVVSSQRLYDILKLLGREGERKIDGSVATQVAAKAGAKWMLLGNILRLEPQVVLTSQLVDVATGDAIASQRITGDKGEDMFSLVDKLTIEIKKDLALPAAAKSEPDRSVRDVTTQSPEAYRYYLEGVELFNKIYFAEADRSFRKALEYDSTFAMAYYFLAMDASGSEMKELTAKAVKYSDRVSWKEKQYIRAQDAYISGDYTRAIKETEKIVERYPDEKTAFCWSATIYQFQLGEPEEAVRLLTKAIEIDPLYKMAYNFLAYAYDDMDDFDKSIWAINKYISIAPDEANPYDSRGDLYAYNGKIDEAIESYQKALEVKPDFSASFDKLGHMYLFKKEYAKAEDYYRQISASSERSRRAAGRTYLAYIPFYQGKFDEALEVLDNGLAADRMEQYDGAQNASKHFLKSEIYEEKGNWEKALKEQEDGMEIWHKANPWDPAYRRDDYVHILTESGRIDKAKEVALALKTDIEQKDPTYMSAYWFASSFVARAQGDTKTAVIDLEKTATNPNFPRLLVGLLLGEMHLESGRLGEAVTELEKALSRYDNTRLMYAVGAVKGHYLLGLAYEKSGWTNKAIQQYEEFLDIWKNADPGIEEIQDAKDHLARLRSES
jgi:serine/threonine protein kinase/tetratricopeptide (TPR) repeat protein